MIGKEAESIGTGVKCVLSQSKPWLQQKESVLQGMGWAAVPHGSVGLLESLNIEGVLEGLESQLSVRGLALALEHWRALVGQLQNGNNTKDQQLLFALAKAL